MVAWEKICKPNSHAGLGLDDHEVLHKVLGAKLWWRWLKDSASCWAQIWKQKYANNGQDRDHIRMSRIIKGYHIWSKAWENRDIVQKHNFWEITDGNLAWFWEDKWQQEPKLLREEFANLKNKTNNKRLVKVNDFWDQEKSEGKWRIWKNLEYNDDSPLQAQAEALTAILEQRKILTSIDSDQLRWGNNNEGNFNLKDAKCIAIGLDIPNLDWVWKDLWQNPSWMKIKLFMWLVQHKKNSNLGKPEEKRGSWSI